MSKIERPEMYVSLPQFNWELVRERDNLIKRSKEVIWLEFNENGTFKSKHDEPAIGRSLLMSPFNQFFTWQTTSITEIIENTGNFVKFKTRNSVYTLTKLNNEE
jgi:hypothetical protein